MVPLADGRVLVGGATCVEIFDPATRTFRATGRPAAVRLVAPATLLRNGRVFVGGAPTSNLDQPYTNSAAILTNDELYDPATGRFTPISPVRTRQRSAAVQLPDGRVLIVAPQAVGPEGLTGEPAFAELFDPKAGTFTAAGPLAFRVTAPVLILQANGKVLVAEPGGRNVLTQLFDPATNTFRETQGQLEGGQACAELPTGAILFVKAYMGPAYSYDPRTESFHRLAPMATSTQIQYYTCTPLTDGRVLVVGESLTAANEAQTESTMLAAQIFDPAHDTWTDLGELNLRRRQGDVRVTFGVAPLPNGSAIVIADEPGGGTGSTPELFDPKTNKFVVNE